MSWMAKLYETYEQGLLLDLPLDKRLMPVSHTIQNAHVNISIDIEGNFLAAKILEKTQIFLPATESSAGRSSGEAPHPLADKIQYVAKDYEFYGGKKKAYFESYRQQLEAWCDSEFSHPKAIAVLRYIKKGTVVKDLIDSAVLHISNKNELLTRWLDTEIDPPLIFKVLPKEAGELDQGNALIFWSVETAGDPESNTWQSEDLQKSWINYDLANGGKVGFCYVIGEHHALAINHPAKLRHTGDKAKLVSANDLGGYTFKGRFTDSDKSIVDQGYQSVGISFEVTQKAHNALRWLITRQGSRNGDQVIVAWAVSGKALFDPTQDSWAMFSEETPGNFDYLSSEPLQDVDNNIDFGQSFAVKLNKYIAGYKTIFSATENIVIMALDSATPGRMGITYYAEMFAHEFIDKVACWHKDLAWFQRHKQEIPNGNKKPRSRVIWPVGAPAPKIIWEAVYGKTLTDTLKKNLAERILPCIVEGKPIPFDIVNHCIKRASNPNGSEHWEWETCLGIACSLYKGHYCRHPDLKKRRTYRMGLDETYRERDYLYGRLLAVAEKIEQVALNIAGENRATTAERMMQRFADRPFVTWRNIELALRPYMHRLKNSRAGFLVNRQKDLDAILNAFEIEEFKSDKPLTGEFLLGFHAQRLFLNQKNEVSDESE